MIVGNAFVVLIGYVLAFFALFTAIVKYRQINPLWLPILVVGLLLGVGPFIGLAFVLSNISLFSGNAAPTPYRPQKQAEVQYRAGNYQLYSAPVAPKTPLSPVLTVLKVIGGVIAVGAILYGLFIVGIILLFMFAPSVMCGGSSKCM